MAKKTSTWEIPYPDLTDTANIPEAMEKMAEAIEDGFTKLNNNIINCFPIGTIIQSSVNNNPANYIGGTWELITDNFLIGAGNKYTVNATGGSTTVALTASQLPNITGSFTGSSNVIRNVSTGGVFSEASGVFSTVSNSTTTSQADATVSTNTTINQVKMSFGGGEAHNNMPPYQAVYMWERTA